MDLGLWKQRQAERREQGRGKEKRVTLKRLGNDCELSCYSCMVGSRGLGYCRVLTDFSEVFVPVPLEAQELASGPGRGNCDEGSALCCNAGMGHDPL